MKNKHNTKATIGKIRQIKKWWSKKKNKPITWGDYAKYCKWTFGIIGLLYLGIYLYFKISSWIESRKAKKTEVEEY